MSLRQVASIITFWQITLLVSSTEVPYLRVIGGREALIDEFPYMVRVVVRTDAVYNCTGSLITPTCVLTAAHCVAGFSPKHITVRGGATTDSEKGVRRRVQYYKVPIDYKSPSMNADVAVLKLDEPLRGHNIRTIPIDYTDVLVDEEVAVAGWGYTEYPPKRTPEGLHTVNVTVIPTKECVKMYAPYAEVTKTMFCAKDEGKDACKGDSGGPVVRNGKVVGIVSWGLHCAILPGVYTKISNSAVSRFLHDATRFDSFCKRN